MKTWRHVEPENYQRKSTKRRSTQSLYRDRQGEHGTGAALLRRVETDDRALYRSLTARTDLPSDDRTIYQRAYRSRKMIRTLADGASWVDVAQSMILARLTGRPVVTSTTWHGRQVASWLKTKEPIYARKDHGSPIIDRDTWSLALRSVRYGGQVTDQDECRSDRTRSGGLPPVMLRDLESIGGGAVLKGRDPQGWKEAVSIYLQHVDFERQYLAPLILSGREVCAQSLPSGAKDLLWRLASSAHGGMARGDCPISTLLRWIAGGVPKPSSALKERKAKTSKRPKPTPLASSTTQDEAKGWVIVQSATKRPLKALHDYAFPPEVSAKVLRLAKRWAKHDPEQTTVAIRRAAQAYSLRTKTINA